MYIRLGQEENQRGKSYFPSDTRIELASFCLFGTGVL